MATLVTIVVPDVNVVRQLYDRIKVYRATTGIAGTYTEITDATTRLPLKEDVSVYRFTDPTGDATYYYKVSYFNATTLAESQLSNPRLGEGDPALEVLSVDDLKTNFLFGLDLTDPAGNTIPDTAFEFYIRAAVAWLERELDIAILPTAIVDERHDYFEEDYRALSPIQLHRFPVISIDNVELWLPNNVKVITYESSWIHTFHDVGQFNIIPGTSGNPFLINASHFALLRGGAKFLPLVFHVDYTAGFAKGTVPYDIRELVGKVASLGPLNVFGDITLGAGIQSQSLSMDGLNETVTTTNSSTNAGFGARILVYVRDLKRQLPILRRAMHPVGLAVA